MTTHVNKSIEVNVPVTTVYNQWTQFEEFPHFMGGIKSVTQLTDDRLEWVAEIGGVKRRWKARIVEQVPDQKVAWAAIEGATNAGAVTFKDLGGRTEVRLTLEYEPEGIVEKAGDALNVVDRQAEADLKRFKEFIEAEGYATGAWRGSVADGGTPGVEDAEATLGDSGKAGPGKATAAAVGLGLAAAGAAAVAGTKKAKESAVPGETITPASGATDLGSDAADADFVGTTEADATGVGTTGVGTTGVGTTGVGTTGAATGGPDRTDALIDEALQPATDEDDPAHPGAGTGGLGR